MLTAGDSSPCGEEVVRRLGGRRAGGVVGGEQVDLPLEERPPQPFGLPSAAERRSALGDRSQPLQVLCA